MTSSPMLDRLTSDEQREKDKRNERRARYSQVAITITLILLLAAWVFGLAKSWLYPSETVTEIQISNVRAMGAVIVCPGDSISASYSFHGDGVGNLLADRTVDDATTGETVVFGKASRIIYDKVADKPVKESLIVPDLPPGQYLFKVSVSSSSRSTAFDSGEFTFTVRADCK